MPLLIIPLALTALLGAGTGFWREVTGSNNSTGPNLVTLALLGGGAYLLYTRVLKKGR